MKKPFNLVAERPTFHLAGPIDPDGEPVEPEHWKTLLVKIYDYFLKNPLDFEFNMILSN